jgi:signal transduction histidine kinase
MGRLRPLPTLVFGFLVGLFLASLDKILPHQTAQGPLRVLVDAVDWLAPPVAGTFLGVALLFAVRHQRLLAAERAASQVLAERLAGTERRQAIWVVAASIAHDLKNPLHNLQLLFEELEGDASRLTELLPRLRDNLSRASERLAELARAGQMPAEGAGVVPLDQVLQELQERLQPAALRAGTDLSVDCPAGLEVRADPIAIRSAVENVAANALDALQQQSRRGRLRLKAGPSDPGLVELLIEDDGPGIPDDLRERLFLPFNSDKVSGSGLGLAIARALVRACEGDLICRESGPGCTVFRFTFPGLPGQTKS